MSHLMHPTEDELILHYYGEDETSEQAVEGHLASCEGCREAFQGLRRVMEAIDAAPVPEPEVDFERSVWARLAPQLNPVGARHRTRWNIWRTLAFSGGLAAVIVSILLWQFDVNIRRTATEEVLTADAESHRERVLLTAVSDHIEQSQLVLVELANAQTQDGDLDVTLERTTADDLVSAGRLYRETARQSGDLQLASLLDELELVLVEIARGPEALSADELEAVRAQIEDQELIFKLRVLAADVKARQQTARPLQGTSKRTL
jgi:hypothetical protein